METKSLMILVAGPYRSGTNDDPARMAENLAKLESVTLDLFRAGHLPVIGEWIALPLLHLAGSKVPGDSPDKEILYPVAARLLQKCDAILRLEGASNGADEDVRIGKERGLAIFYSLSEVPGVN